jgi:hypothetical protein
MKRLILLLTIQASVAFCAGTNHEVRAWTMYGATIKGAFVEDNAEKVLIRTKSGRELAVSKSGLSDADQKYLTSLDPPPEEPTEKTKHTTPTRPQRSRAMRNIVTLDKDFFGLKLGAPVWSFREACAKKELAVETNKFTFAEKLHPGVKHSCAGSLVEGDLALETVAWIVDNTIYGIEVHLSETHEDDYYDFRRALEGKYHRRAASLEDAAQERSDFTTTVDRRKVAVTLVYSKRSLVITYIYDAAERVVREEIQRREKVLEREIRSRKLSKQAYSW